ELAMAQPGLLNRRFRTPGRPEREQTLVEAEVERILLRKEPRSGRKLTREQVDSLLSELDTSNEASRLTSLNRLVKELVISRRIATAVEVAGEAGRATGGVTHG
ncbi:MAG: hypothetical protein C4289_08250, partial [Chloroflexota bacterium]